MGVLDALGWLIERPQQALFQGAQAGANASGAYDTAMQNAGVPAGLSNQAAQILSLAPMLYGAVKGLTGIGDRVTGENLTQDFTGSPEWDRAIGNQINVTADPLAVLLGGAKIPGLGKVVDKLSGLGVGTTAGTLDELAGQVARTAGNIYDTKRLQPSTIGKLDEHIGNTWSKYLLDLAATPQSAAEPLAVRTANKPGAFANAMGYKAGGRPINEDLARGFKPKDNNIVAYWQGSQETTLPHELTHWARSALPEMLQAPANRAYEAVTAANPKKAADLMRSPAYAKKNAADMGDEILARYGDDVLKSLGYRANPLKNVLARANDAIQPSMYQDAGPLGISLIPQAANAWAELWR